MIAEEWAPLIVSIIFDAADNIIVKDKKADSAIVIEFPVILRLLYICGLRIGETIRIRLSDVDFERGILYMYNTKNDKHRIVPVSNEMKVILQKYRIVNVLLDMNEEWLFPSQVKKGEYISERSIKNKFTTIIKRNGIEVPNRKKRERGPCLHCLRHVFAFKSFEQSERAGRHLNDAIPYLSIYLGHDSLNETSKYLKFSNELFLEAIDCFGNFMDSLISEVDYEA